MKKLIWDDETEEIDLGDGDYVTILPSLRVEDMAVIGAAASQVEVSIGLLHRLVKSWRGPSFEKNGEPVPVTPDNIDRLEMGAANVIASLIAERINSRGMDDEEKKDSTES